MNAWQQIMNSVLPSQFTSAPGFLNCKLQANSLNKYIEITFPKAAGFQLFLYGVEFNFLKSKRYRSSRCPKSCLLVSSQAQAPCKYSPNPWTTNPSSGRELVVPHQAKTQLSQKAPSLHDSTSPTCSWSCLNTCKQQPTCHINSSQWKPK